MPTPMYAEDYDKNLDKVVDEADIAQGVRVVSELPATGVYGELVLKDMGGGKYILYVWK